MALDYLSLYGPSFQSRVIALLLSDKDFLIKTYDSLTAEYFDSDSNKLIINIIKSHYDKYNDLPTAQSMLIEVSKIDGEIVKESVKEQLKNAYKILQQKEDFRPVKDEFFNFCKNQRMKTAIMECVPLIKEGKYDVIESIINGASRFGMSSDIGLDYTANVHERYAELPRKRIIPTEWAPINEIIDGGLGEGDLGVVVGVSGIGKSWFLTAIGLHALKMGKNVLHVTLELNKTYSARRYDSRLTGIVASNLKYHVDDVVNKIESECNIGKLLIQHYPPKTASVTTIKSHINKCKAFGFNPDILLLDYADLLRDSRTSKDQSTYTEMGSVYEDLRGLGGEFEISVWTVSQAQRSATEDDIVTGDKIADSYKKIMTADFVMSVSRLINDKLANTARWHVIKNRYGPDALTFPSKMDTSVGKIDIHTPTSVLGTEVRKDMRNSNELVRKELSERFGDFE